MPIHQDKNENVAITTKGAKEYKYPYGRPTINTDHLPEKKTEEEIQNSYIKCAKLWEQSEDDDVERKVRKIFEDMFKENPDLHIDRIVVLSLGPLSRSDMEENLKVSLYQLAMVDTMHHELGKLPLC